jgi:hypothetical protein
MLKVAVQVEPESKVVPKVVEVGSKVVLNVIVLGMSDIWRISCSTHNNPAPDDEATRALIRNK